MAELLRKQDLTPGAVAEGGTMARLETGSWRTYVPITDLEKCVHCMTCWVLCPDGAILVEDGKKVGTDLEHCKGCGVCATECPVKAIQMKLESEVGPDERKG